MQKAQGLGDEHVPDRMGAQAYFFSGFLFFPGSGSAAPLSSSDVCFILPVQVENWEKQRESGTYPGPVPGEKKGGDHH